MIYLERLQKAKKRLEVLEAELSRPEVIRDQTNYQKMTRELAGLRPLVGAFARYEKITEEIEGIRRGLGESELDVDLKNLYEDEIAALETQKTATQNEIEALLLKDMDPDSGRDVIVEIRAGTGGE